MGLALVSLVWLLMVDTIIERRNDHIFNYLIIERRNWLQNKIFPTHLL